MQPSTWIAMHQSPRRTKIVATWGPTVASEERIRQLVQAGVDVFRLNFSHGTHEQFSETIPLIRSIAKEEGRHVAFLQDIQGPRLRTGILNGSKQVELKTGSTVTIVTQDGTGTSERFAIAYPRLTQDVKPGHRILIADGTIALRAAAVENGAIEATVLNGGMLGEHKGVNLPDSSVSAEPLTPKDEADLAFGVKMDVDYVALSFVRRRDDVLACRRLVARLGGRAPIISKIEHPEAITNLEEILAASDGIMVARGDLGVEVTAERVPLLQKHMIQRCNELGLPVITATQMLDSMIERPVPTRAEASDIANAIFDGTDALMLSGETAAGKFPIHAVETMARIAREAEAVDFPPLSYPTQEQSHALARGARALASHLAARAMLVFTRSGNSAQVLAQQRPTMPIYALSGSAAVCRRLMLWYGVHPIEMDLVEDVETMVQAGIRELLRRDVVDPGDRIVILGSSPVNVGGLPNFISVRTITTE
ncbi:MAG: pyruvate kinase [Dehalococcoidia bacterium]